MKCKNCNDTGYTESGYLDCAALGCTAAEELVALIEAMPKFPLAYPNEIWEAYQLGKAQSKWLDAKFHFPENTENNDLWVWASWIGAGEWHQEQKQGLARYIVQLGWQPQGCMGWDWNVTHWMPLPQPPKD